jgi:hypothetical protein
MNRFFRASPETYETIRTAMDTASGYPSTQADTWFAPIESSPKDADGNPLIAAIEPIATQFVAAGAEELTVEEFQSLIPQPEPDII